MRPQRGESLPQPPRDGVKPPLLPAQGTRDKSPAHGVPTLTELWVKA